MLRIGTDCSGIEAPIQALKKLKVSFSHEFASDIDPYCEQSIFANYKPKKFYKDITTRIHSELPDIDLYICGFPCQPFSSAGSRQGIYDIRGTVFQHCVETIRVKKPTFFILENVKGLVTMDNGNLFEFILNKLRALKHYSIDWNILNTKDYGIPQNRERLFIIGIDKRYKNFVSSSGSKLFEFVWPEKKKKVKDIYTFIDKSDTTKEPYPNYIKNSSFFKNIPKEAVFVNFGFTQNKHRMASEFLSPCLTTTNQLWCLPMHRRANIKEYLKLQGFPTSFKQVVSDFQMKKQIGNSMSVCVLEAILSNLLFNE